MNKRNVGSIGIVKMKMRLSQKQKTPKKCRIEALEMSGYEKAARLREPQPDSTPRY